MPSIHPVWKDPDSDILRLIQQRSTWEQSERTKTVDTDHERTVSQPLDKERHSPSDAAVTPPLPAPLAMQVAPRKMGNSAPHWVAPPATKEEISSLGPLLQPLRMQNRPYRGDKDEADALQKCIRESEIEAELRKFQDSVRSQLNKNQPTKTIVGNTPSLQTSEENTDWSQLNNNQHRQVVQTAWKNATTIPRRFGE